MTKKTLITLGIAGTTALCAGGFSVAHAAATSGPGTLAQKIAQTFNLDPSKVQDVISQTRDQNQARREADYEQRLSQAVTHGKLTVAQKAAILAEHQTLEAQMQAALAKTGGDRRAAVKAVAADAKAWAKANNVDAKWLLSVRPHLRGSDQPAPSPTPAS